MGTLKEYYQEKYGKPSQAPATVEAFQDGQKLGAAFNDELLKLQAKFAEEVKKDKSTHPILRFLTHPATLGVSGGLSGAQMGAQMADMAHGFGASGKAKAIGALIGALGVGGASVAESRWHRQNAAARAAKGEKAHWANRIFGPAGVFDKALVGRRNAGTEAEYEKEKK